MASTPNSELSDGPVLSLINKRLRALRKKYNRIIQMEESVAQGKTLNKEQDEVFRSKPAVSTLIDELEKLRQPLSAAVQEELTLALKTNQAPAAPPADENLKPTEPDQDKPESGDALVEELLNLLYFGSMFDVKSQSDFGSMCLIRTHERECCLSYDYVTDEATDLLLEKDLDLISQLSGLLISRPADSSLSHRDALQRCVEHAKAWLAKSNKPIEPNAEATYVKLRERLHKIMASDYFTTTPEIKPPALEMAAAAANYAPFQVLAQGVSAPAPVQGEGPVGQYLQKDDETANFQEHETGESHSSSVQEHQKDELDAEIPQENISTQQEQVNQEVEMEHNQREFDTREQQYNNRRGYQNQRGRGGRGRGYSNGRGGRSGGRGGGGPYQNGRNQQYDQPGNYYPRGYQNSRGGGGGRGGGYNNRGSSAQGGHNPSDVGVGA